MQKVLRKRVLRDLKNNLFRYIALAFLIIMGMYVIVSLIGAGYTIIDNGETHDEANKIEDGQFSVFVPLSDDEISQLEDAGAEVEGMFYEDYEVMDGKTLRVFANRENIDLVECDEGNHLIIMLFSRRCQIQLSTARCLEQYSLQRVHMINFMQQARVLRQRHIFMRSDLRVRPPVMT